MYQLIAWLDDIRCMSVKSTDLQAVVRHATWWMGFTGNRRVTIEKL